MGRQGFVRGIIFDFDGVLIDTEPIYLRTVNEVLQEIGVPPMTREANRDLIGTPAGHTWDTLHARYELPQPASYYERLYDERLEGVLQRELTLRPTADVFLREVAERGLPRGLATSSRRKWMELKLRVLELEGYFCSVVSAEDVGHAKPEPHVYLRAAAETGVSTEAALAIEDSPSGIAAAKAAGIYTIALRTTSTEGMDLSAADEVIDSLNEINLDILLESAASEGALQCR
jgi:HAD superfamily hydrolase (TIGR01509 family)